MTDEPTATRTSTASSALDHYPRARFAAEFQALDSLRVAEALDRRLQTAGRSLDVLVQVNTSGEASKYGLAPAEVAAFLRKLPAFTSLRVRGQRLLAGVTATRLIPHVRGYARAAIDPHHCTIRPRHDIVLDHGLVSKILGRVHH